MRAGDLMQDPYFATIIFAIESHIYDHDLKLKSEEGVEMKDSGVKSAIRKAIGTLRGARASKPAKKKEDQLKEALAAELVRLHETGPATEGVSRGDYVKALLAVEDSLKLRREMAGHSKGYLDYLGEFIPQARGKSGN
jgi:hypothetical protein